ncbi:MAG: glucuronate isomerase [Clostridiales bacterium]|jgi:glucuronate isomerase|nr:glucuronate isomerase [Clostridiales bacterium]
MKKFMGKKFMLNNDTAVRLFGEVKNLPIIDYHCHLNPAEIAENKRFRNITELWLGGDHYKWRLMRANGVIEEYITGGADDYDKFTKWAATVEESIGNPLYHWTHLELSRIFGYNGVLKASTAKEVWEHCNGVIADKRFCVKSLFEKFNVEAVCTTDDPADSLEHHKKIKNENLFATKVLPAFRPSKIFDIETTGWSEYVSKLAAPGKQTVKSFDDVVEVLRKRAEFFAKNGCRLSDHALDPPVFAEYTPEGLDGAVAKALEGKPVSPEEAAQYKTALLVELGKKYFDLGWAMQLHMGALRSVNTRMFGKLGPDTGFDCTGDYIYALPLAKILNAMESANKLPRTVLYCLNARDYEIIAPMAQCFQGEGIKGKVQFGTGWWHNDQTDGMRRQMITLAGMGLFSCFVGMLTDSRSFLSYPRHEYFRRILCNLVGSWAERGEYPYDLPKLTDIVKNISYHNAKEYFGLKG